MGTSRKKCYYQSSLLKRFTLFELRSTEGWSIYLENIFLFVRYNVKDIVYLDILS